MWPTLREPAEFERVLRLGLGRAILLLRTHDAAPSRAAILDACVHHTAYDPQVEGRRTAYLWDVLAASGDPSVFLDDLLAALLEVTTYWDADQLFDLARHFAQAGHDRAREAMYAKFRQNDAEEPFVGAEALIRLDGLDGLLAVAEQVGQTLQADPRAWVDPWLFVVANDVCGEQPARAALEAARRTRPAIGAFVDALDAERAQRPATRRQYPDLSGAPYARVRASIAAPESRRLGLVALRRWGQAAPEDELAQAATDLLHERDDEDRLIGYLRIFGKRRFPLDPAPLLSLVRHADTRLAAAAFAALGQLSNARIRQAALDLLDDGQASGWQRGRALCLLARNHQPGDTARLADWLRGARDDDELHAIGIGVRHVLEAHSTPAGAAALLDLYERGPCSICRAHAVELLHGVDALPAWLADECQFDANLDLRATLTAWRTPSAAN